MGLSELQRLWKLGETKRVLWVMGVLFITITLYQYIELPKGISVLSIFSKGNTALMSVDSAPLPVGLKANSSVSEEVGAPEPSSSALDESNDPLDLDGPLLDDVKEELNATKLVFALAPSVSPILQAQPPTTYVSVPDNNATPPSISHLNFTQPNPPPLRIPVEEGRYQTPTRDVYTLADMDELLADATHSMAPRWSSKIDQELLVAKLDVQNAAPSPNDLQLYGPLYRNVSMFRRSYELMEQMLKVYVYKEGDMPVFHKPPLEGIYASEGWFMKLMESNKHFITRDPRKAHLFYLPFSSRNLEEALYVPNSHTHKNLINYLEKYLDAIIAKYSFWNRTGGADHFLVACHDWAPSETRRIMSSCIRALCNADVKEGFKLGKDVSLPETYIPNARNPLRGRGGKSPSRRRTLAFFAGQMHGYLRPILLRHWENVDPNMKIFGTLPHVKGNRNYVGYMQSSKYCICAKGYEVNSPRVVEAIFYECVPVIISDNFVPPFFETLNWESFAVFVAEKDIPNLKNILESIPKKTYLRLYMRVKKVQQHFLWHPNPVKYDLFHMILHSIWYNRVFQFKPRTHDL